MAIKPHKPHKTTALINRVIRDLGQTMGYADLPKEIFEKIKNLKEEVKNFDIGVLNSEKKIIEGHIALPEEILQTIKEVSGYSQWEIYDPYNDDESELQDNIDFIKEHYHVEFDAKSVNSYFVDRNTHNRNEIGLIRITALPGYLQLAYDTDKVGWCEDNLLTLSEFKSALTREFS